MSVLGDGVLIRVRKGTSRVHGLHKDKKVSKVFFFFFKKEIFSPDGNEKVF